MSDGDAAAEGDSPSDCRCDTVFRTVPLFIGVLDGVGAVVSENSSEVSAEAVRLCVCSTLSDAREDGRGERERVPETDDVMEAEELLEPRSIHRQ